MLGMGDLRMVGAKAALGAALGVGLLAGCGQTIVGGGTGTPQAPKNCGTVASGPTAVQPSDPSSVENCFYDGFTRCAAVTMTYSQMGVDAGVTRTFKAQPKGGGCGVSDTVHNYVIPTKTDHTATYDCASVARKGGGLLFSACGQDGDVLVPGASSAP